MKRKISVLLSVIMFILCCGGCNSKTVRSADVSTELTQTKVVLSELPAADEDFAEFLGAASPMFFTPGLMEQFVPQGLCYCDEKKYVIISGYYPDDAEASRIAIVDNATGELINSVGFVDDSNEKLYGHFGGVACSENTVYVTCDGRAYFVSLADVCNAEKNSYIEFDGSFELLTKGSYANYQEGVLWIGEFVEDSKKEKENAEHITTLDSGETMFAWCEAYRLANGKPDEVRKNKSGTGYIPEAILAIPLQVQGMTVTDDFKFIFSTSYGRKNNSQILVYNNVFEGNAYEEREMDGLKVMLFCFAEKDLLKKYTAIPMSQGIDIADNKVVILFESGADIYRNHGGKYPTDYVFELDIP